MTTSVDSAGGISRRRAAGLGLLAGLLNGLIALSGGVLITPVLIVGGVGPQTAVGTSLAAVTMLSCVGFSVHMLLGGLSLGLVPIAASVAGGIAGSLLGSKILARITPHWMPLLLAAIQILVAVRLIDQGLGTTLFGVVENSVPPVWAYVGLGLFAGTLSGIFGVRGGALVLLGLAAFYGVPVGEGLAIALALNVSNALAGVVNHVRHRRVLWHELTVLIPMAVGGIAVGAALAHELPVNTMRVVFGGFFLFMSILLGRKGWAAAKASRGEETGRANSSRP